MTPRPRSLAEVAERATDSRLFHVELRDLLDEFRRVGTPDMLAEVPRSLAGRFPDGDVADAYLAAVAVSLAREIGVMPPAWVLDESRTLRRPWFASPGPAIRATLLAESPAPFRERNLFVGRNALSRA